MRGSSLRDPYHRSPGAVEGVDGQGCRRSPAEKGARRRWGTALNPDIAQPFFHESRGNGLSPPTRAGGCDVPYVESVAALSVVMRRRSRQVIRQHEIVGGPILVLIAIGQGGRLPRRASRPRPACHVNCRASGNSAGSHFPSLALPKSRAQKPLFASLSRFSRSTVFVDQAGEPSPVTIGRIVNGPTLSRMPRAALLTGSGSFTSYPPKSRAQRPLPSSSRSSL